MKKITIKYIRFFLASSSIMILSACSSFLEVDTPLGEVNADKVFTSEASTESAIVGLYSQMMLTNTQFLNGALSIYGGLSADELYNTSPNTSYDPFRINTIPSANLVISNNMWKFAYIYLYQANLILENLPSANISDQIKKKYEGEMRFVRGLCYFYLVNLFGDVPLITGSDYEVNRLASRVSEETVYDFILKELITAETLLEGQEMESDRSRPDVYAVKSLLARVYLYKKDNSNAALKASEVINSNKFKLETDLAKTFISSSTEAIFQLRPSGANFNSAEGFIFIPTSATTRPVLALYDNLIETFSSTDLRATQWISQRAVAGINYYYPTKYKVRSGATKTEFNVVLRLAEQFLIRAEAQFERNPSEAIKDLNTIRKRAGLNDLPNNLNKTDFQNALMIERQHELFAEWGHRWLDLKRLGKTTEILSTLKPDWSKTKELYPIPNYEIWRNPKMIQNEGYSD